MHKHVKKMLRAATAAGCTITTTKKQHHKVRCPNGQVVVVAGTPSTTRSTTNEIARIRRLGEMPDFMR